MDIRLGTDLVYIPRIRDAVQRLGDRCLQRIYTRSEQHVCGVTIAPDCDRQDHPSPGIPLEASPTVIQRLAARWAAKEAVVKALGTGWRGIGYREVGMQRQPNGAPLVHVPVATQLEPRWALRDRQCYPYLSTRKVSWVAFA
ncbi:holo-ACP synthase [Trichothermofontia sp.]